MRWLVKVAVRLVERNLPDPFVLALLLTFVVLALAIGVQGSPPLEAINSWGHGFWSLLGFTMQMTLILVLGHMIASTPVVRRLLDALTQKLPGPRSAIAATTLVALVVSWLNWGCGLVAGAFFARAVARKIAVDYRLLVASAYSGFIVWHGGLAGSIPLAVNTPGHFMEAEMGLLPLARTIFSPLNLALVAAMVIVLPILNVMMFDRHAPAPAGVILEDEAPAGAGHGPLLHARWPLYLAAAVILVYLVPYFINGGRLTLDATNLLLLGVALGLCGTTSRFLGTLKHALSTVSGIVIQFPFYAGVMAVMQSSGLAEELAVGFANFASANTLPLWTFLSAGLINIFVPSGGGQWAVQAPVMVQAAAHLDVDVAKVTMAVAWGDAWTNLLQPFWALAALTISGLGARDIMGYCLFQLLVCGAIIGVGFYLVA